MAHFLFLALVCGTIGLFFENAGLLLLAAVALLVLSPLLLHVSWRARNHQIVICSEGLLSMARGLNDAVARWDEIEGVQISTHPLTYTIVCKDKTTVKLQAETWVWTQSIQLFATLEREIIRRFLPDAVAQFEQGNPVFFGDVCAGKEGLSGWFGTIPWGEIKGVYMHQAELVVLKTAHRHQRLQFSAEAFNPFVLTALVRHILNAQQA